MIIAPINDGVNVDPCTQGVSIHGRRRLIASGCDCGGKPGIDGKVVVDGVDGADAVRAGAGEVGPDAQIGA